MAILIPDFERKKKKKLFGSFGPQIMKWFLIDDP